MLVPVIGMIFQSAAPTAAFDRSEATFDEPDVVHGMIFQSAAPTAAFDRSEAVFIESDVVHLVCEVFLDTNEDGIRQQGESGLPGVFVTNGVDLIATDAQGRAAISVDRAVYRFATLTIPAGYWPTTSWYAPLPIGSPPPALIEFGLKEFPQTASDPIRWVHISDTQTQSWGEIPAVEEDFQQINELAEPPLFLINTGDLVEVGSDTTHWNHYLDQLTTSAWPVFHVPGNHDTLGTGPPLDNYELYVGPPYYNLRVGSWNFLFLNTERPAAASPKQHRWLEHAIAATPPGTRHIAFQHRALSELLSADAARLAELGIEATFSGHWHALQIARHRQGVLDFNLSRTSVGPLDRTPRSFAIVTLDASSGIDYELRRLRVDHRATVVHPRPDQEVGGDHLEVLVQAYDTSSPVRDLAVAVQSGPYSIPATAMSQEGTSLWRAMVPVDGVPWGPARAMVTGAFEDGTPIQLEVPFVRSEVVSIRRELGEDWPMFRKSAEGSSFTATPVDPPLALAWTTPLPGMVALSSPVVRGGRVFLGCRTESADLDDSGILCCDAATGAPLWYHSLPGGIALAPSVAEDLLLVSTMTDSIFALDAATGDIAWSARTPGNKYKMTAPVWSGDDSWFGSEPTPVEIDWRSGMSRWTTEPLGIIWYPAIYSAPAVSPQHVYFSFYGIPGVSLDGFSVVDRASGMVVHTENGSFRSPIWTGSTLYVVGGWDFNSQRLSARDAFGNVIWTSPVNLGRSTGAPAIGNNVIVVPGNFGAVEGLSATDGSRLWTHQTGWSLYEMSPNRLQQKDVISSAAITGNVVYIGGLDGNLYGLDLATGEELWRWDLGVPVASSPAASGTMLFVGASDGHLYGFAEEDSGQPGPRASDPTFPPRASALAMYAPQPNPSKSRVRFEWTIPQTGRIRLAIYDIAGREVRLVAHEIQDPGDHFAVWDGDDRSGAAVAPGVYLARLQTTDKTLVRKFVRLSR